MNQKIEIDKNKLIFFAVFMVASVLVVFSLPRILIPFGFAYILSLLLRPIRNALFSVSLTKKIAAVLVLGVGVFVFSYPIVKGIKTISLEAHKLEYYVPKVENYLRVKFNTLKTDVKNRYNYEIEVDPVTKLVELGQTSTKTVFIYLPKIIAAILEWGLIIPLFLFFIIKDERKMRFKFLKMIPNSLVERGYFLYHQFNTKFGNYIFAKFIEALVLGSIITIGLLLIGYPFAFILGMVAAVTNILPYIGPFLGFAPALIIGVVDPNLAAFLGPMALLYLIANIFDLAFVFPILVSKIVNLHPMLVVVSVIIGSQIWGVIGMIISIPLTAFLKLVFEQIYDEIYSKA